MENNRKTTPSGKYLNDAGKEEQIKAEKRFEAREQQRKLIQHREKIFTKVGLFLAVMLLTYMVVNGLIHQLLGTIFVAVLSMIFGNRMK